MTIMFKNFTFNETYQPDPEVIESAWNLSGTAYDVGNCVDRLLAADVTSIRQVTNYQGKIPENDQVLLIAYKGWSIHKPYWLDLSDPDHSINTVWCYECEALFLRSELIKQEIDDQFGWSNWIDIETDVYTLTTNDLPQNAIDMYCEIIKYDSTEFAEQWMDSGKPSYSMVNDQIKKALNDAIAKNEKG